MLGRGRKQARIAGLGACSDSVGGEKREGKIKGDGTRACRLPSAPSDQDGTRCGAVRAVDLRQVPELLGFWRAVLAQARCTSPFVG